MTVYIYGLRDPRNNRIRYVGKTTNLRRRLREHIALREHGGLPENRGVKRWIVALAKRGLSPEVTVIQRVAEDCWQEAERFWIATFKEHGQRLLNGSPGGLGGSNKGHKFSPEGRARINEAISKACKGKPLGEEQRRKMSEAKKGKSQTPQHIARRAEGNRRFYAEHPEAKERTKHVGPANGRYGITMSAAQKQLISTNRRGKGLGNQSACRSYPTLYNVRTGEEIVAGKNLLALCMSHKLNRKYLSEVIRGKRNQHKGWTISNTNGGEQCAL